MSLTNPTLTLRTFLFIVIAVASTSILLWIDVPLYDLFFKPPFSAHLDVLLITFIVELGLFVWILYDLLVKAKNSCQSHT